MTDATTDTIIEGGPVSHPPLTGVLPVLQVPFLPDDSIDHEALRSQAQWCLGQGANGLVFGMVSEVVRLGDAERVEAVRTVAGLAADAGVVLVASAGAESTKVAVERAVAAAEAGATALMVTPPMTVRSGEASLREYFLEVARATALPIIVQDASGYVGTPMSIDFQVGLLDALGDQAWFKPEAPPFGQRLSQLRDRSGGRARILEGSGGISLVDSYRRGIVGTMPAADVCWALVALWNALEAGDWETAAAIHGPLGALVTLQTSLDAYVAIEKHLLHRQGIIPSPRMRGPVGFELDPETAAEAERLTDVLHALSTTRITQREEVR